MMKLIEVENLVKYFYSEFRRTPVKILDNVTFDVPKGSTFALLGPNGAGKTTTMKIILGLLKPSSGKILLMGNPVSNKQTRAKIGYMTEAPYLYSYLNGYEFLSFCADLLGLDHKHKKERIEELIHMVGMDDRIYTRLGKCSKGMLQRVGIAQAILNDPDLVLLDEPMSGLDPVGRIDLKNIILSLKKAGKTILFNSHILSDVEDLCDEVAILRRGKIIDRNSLKSILEDGKYASLEDYFIEVIRENKGAA